ncbi:MAG: fibrobacter succinogenes major paralogous domain-containing protein [Fibromonadales bacterium]|nr:fibrobacter succinogenes major paralogous domain-containing protein [Fibromonadales bacterium]
MIVSIKKIAFVAAFEFAFIFTLSCGEHSLGAFLHESKKENEEKKGGSSPCTLTDSRNGTITDTRDGTIYKCVKIDSLIWMAENLNYDVPNNDTDKCYDNDPAKCRTYGRLYNWATAMGVEAKYNNELLGIESSLLGIESSGSYEKHQGICPAGWHIPSRAEWNVLVVNAGRDAAAGRKLKATSGWDDYYNVSGNGTDEYGFAALPGGAYDVNGLNGPGFYDVGHYGYWWTALDNLKSAYYRFMQRAGEGVDSRFCLKDNMFSVRCVQD